MKAVLLQDDVGIKWAVYQDDPLQKYLSLFKDHSHLPVFPKELFHTLDVHPPDWESSSMLWETEGDTPAFRSSVEANLVRELVRKYVDEECSGSL